MELVQSSFDWGPKSRDQAHLHYKVSWKKQKQGPSKQVAENQFGDCVQTVKNLPAMRETQVPSLGQDDPLEKGRATYSTVLA